MPVFHSPKQPCRVWEDQVDAELRQQHIVARKKNGAFYTAALKTLWMKRLWVRIKSNAAFLDSRTGANKNKKAAEGYPDDRRAPNINVSTSRHCLGLAIDATIRWNAGVKTTFTVLGSGDQYDLVTEATVSSFQLNRPVRNPDDPEDTNTNEPHHFQLD